LSQTIWICCLKKENTPPEAGINSCDTAPSKVCASQVSTKALDRHAQVSLSLPQVVLSLV
jgi:hypothetical protein